MTTLPAVRAPLPVLVDEILRVTVALHPDEALARLGPLWDASKPGIARRGLLAARIALMRKAMTAAPLVVAVPDPVVEPEPVIEPVFVPAPIPKPVPLKAGALTLLNLEDAAKMLMAAEDVAPDAPAELPADFNGGDTVAEAVAAADLAGVIAAEAVVVAGKAKKPKAKPAVGGAGRPAAFDLAAQFADMGDDAPDATAAPLDLAAQFAAMGTDADPVPPKAAKKGKPAAMAMDLSAQLAALGDDAPDATAAPLDLAAQFAALGTDAEAAPPKAAKKAKPAAMAMDLSAQLAALGDDAPDATAAPLDLAAQFAAMGTDADAAPPKPAKKAKAAGLAIDLSAQFAALGEE